jgi:hypothetical protein
MSLALLLAVGNVLPDACRAAPEAPSPLPGPQLRLVLGSRTAMVYEPRSPAPPLPLAGQQGQAAPSIGLEFRTPPSHANGPRGLLRVQLSSDAALQFRPRRGGLAVSYRADF